MEDPLIFVLGHPLLDIQVTHQGANALLEKYSLLPNNGILAEERHMSIFDEIVREHDVTYVAGGTANAARAAAYVLPPGAVVYTGCVGDDALRDQLSAANAREGVLEVYDVRKDKQTGACAVLITGHNRSMVTSLRAAEDFSTDWLGAPQIATHIASAKLFYAEGYFLTHGLDSLLFLARKSAEAGKTFVLNISAPYVPKFYKSELDEIMSLSDIIICNVSEAQAWALVSGLSGDVLDIAVALAKFPRAGAMRPRISIITQGPDDTVVASSDNEVPQIYPVDAVPDELIVDTNGAGDAFTGGFLAAFALGMPLDKCIRIAHKMGAMCVQMTGAQFKFPKLTILD